jgi:cell wall-associated NlpC family hydrolase
VSLGGLIEQVDQVLNRGHALFGDPLHGGDVAGLDAGFGLTGARDRLRGGQARVARLSGRAPAAYGRFAAQSAPALDDAAATDTALSRRVRDTTSSDRSGRARSGAVVHGAAADTAALSPLAATAPGQRAIVAALRARLAQQQRLVAAYHIRDARLAAALRSMAYPRRRAASPLGAVSGLSGPAPGRRPAAALTSGIGRAPGRTADVPAEPGQGAAEAALSRLGRPYVWGAKGPNAFDCSGLTRWAWRQAGVELGNDTYTQLRQGVPVAPGRVRAGDLIFPLDSFGEAGRGGPGHVQLAVSAHEVVHAPEAGDVVRLAPMPNRFLARRPVRATTEL